ncbi:histone-lysine N-methyltransferase 2B-like isoform X1 [Lemur catta]|uniref:histone-lysine N-methyltransferase 2B-like isoform X1 n=1 Tax=Lemur catta TaxID=9447 RepID=UPI001E2696AF|nr:histone-lysine N-methyltransferase 2B-like isoform X1 [Lemur catta]
MGNTESELLSHATPKFLTHRIHGRVFETSFCWDKLRAPRPSQPAPPPTPASPALPRQPRPFFLPTVRFSQLYQPLLVIPPGSGSNVHYPGNPSLASPFPPQPHQARNDNCVPVYVCLTAPV